MSFDDPYHELDLEETDEAQYTQRPDGSVVVKPHVKKVKTGTWVFYPNSKSQGRNYKSYGKAKRLGGEPDVEYNPRRGGQPEEMIEEQQYVEQQQPQPQPRGGGSVFDEVLRPAGMANPVNDMNNSISSFLGGGGGQRRPQRSMLDLGF